MNPQAEALKGGRMVEKMEQVLRYVKSMKIKSPNKISGIPKCRSLQIVAQIKKKELIG